MKSMYNNVPKSSQESNLCYPCETHHSVFQLRGQILASLLHVCKGLKTLDSRTKDSCETHHLVFQLRGQILTSLCVPCPFVDAFHKGMYDEHSILHVSQHREDDDFCTEEDPSIAA